MQRPEAARAPAGLAGLDARKLAVALLESVLSKRRTLEEALAGAAAQPAFAALDPRDRAFARLIAASVLRRLGSLEHVIGTFLDRPLPGEAVRIRMILAAAAAQLLLLGTPAHAVINLAVEQCRRDRLARRFDKLANALLRRLASDGPAILARADTLRLDVPDWLWKRWTRTYGEATARLIAEASLREAPLDVSVKSDPSTWAGKLGGHLLATGGIRLEPASRVDELPGYAEGEWWVQDAAASLPARVLGDVSGLAVADLCAAPGGKTAELAAAGAHTTAVDASERRLATLTANLKRLRLEDRVRVVHADLDAWEPAERFDAVLLDAPCTATGTIRRHPDILRLRGDDDVRRLAALQARLLARAVHFLKPGGTLVYSTCSLEPEEGQDQIERLLASTSAFSRIPVVPSEVANQEQWITPAGDLRTLPHQLALDRPELSGLDGFYAARLKHRV